MGRTHPYRNSQTPETPSIEREPSMIRNSIVLLLAFAVCSFAPALQPGEPFKAGKLPPAAVAALQPGLTLRFYAKADDAKPLDARRVRLAALHVPQGTPPSP